MTPVQVRPFRRADRGQLTALVNAHAQAVVPGVAVSVNSVLSQLEAEPGEFIVDPWVDRRATLVAEQRGWVVAAAHLLRYRSDGDVGGSCRDVGARWLLCWPPAPFWPDTDAAGDAVAAAAVAWLQHSGAGRLYADGTLRRPVCTGCPSSGRTCTPSCATRRLHPWRARRGRLARRRRRAAAPALTAGRADRGPHPRVNGTRFTALRDEQPVGHLEVQQRGDAGRLVTQHGFADIGSLHVDPVHRRRGIASWLLGSAADWLHLGHIDRLLDYCSPDDEGYRAFLQHAGFHPLTCTTHGWERPTTTAL